MAWPSGSSLLRGEWELKRSTLTYPGLVSPSQGTRLSFFRCPAGLHTAGLVGSVEEWQGRARRARTHRVIILRALRKPRQMVRWGIRCCSNQERKNLLTIKGRLRRAQVLMSSCLACSVPGQRIFGLSQASSVCLGKWELRAFRNCTWSFT